MQKAETSTRITPDLLCKAYALGVFPMASSRESNELIWVEPQVRGILPLDKFHLSRRDQRAIRKANFITTLNHDFSATVRGCAERLRENSRENKHSDNLQNSLQHSHNDSLADSQQSSAGDTWINAEIEQVYGELHKQGYAHSVEVYACQEDSRERHLVGGLYGVALGAAFFGESMFSSQSNASKAALAYLVERLRACDYQLLDVQFQTPHLQRFGVLEVSRQKYLQYLCLALQKKRQLR